jgi:L-rhamnose isomerase / sugar isomerase
VFAVMDGDFGYRIPADLIARENRERADDIDRDYEGLRESLRRAGVLSRLGQDLDQITAQVAKFEAAIPSASLGDGQTTVFEKLVDAKTVHSLCGAAPRVALQVPGDRVDDPLELREYARRLEIGFGTVSAGAPVHADPAVRSKEAERVHAAIEFGRAVGSDGLSVALGGGAMIPGEVHFRRSLDRTIEGLEAPCRALPEGWRLFLSQSGDWGTAFAAAQALGERAFCMIDLEGAPPDSRPELAAARLIALAKLGGVHCAESASAGGALDPYRLFLVFCELADAEGDPEVGKDLFRPAFTIGGIPRSRDPIEELLLSVEAVLLAHAKALLVDRAGLSKVQDRNDVVAAVGLLKRAHETDVRPILRRARVQKGAAADPLEVYRSARYREEKARERKEKR